MKIISRLFAAIRLIHSRHLFLVDMSDANDPNATPDKEKGPDFQENMKEMLASAMADVREDILKPLISNLMNGQKAWTTMKLIMTTRHLTLV